MHCDDLNLLKPCKGSQRDDVFHYMSIFFPLEII